MKPSHDETCGSPLTYSISILQENAENTVYILCLSLPSVCVCFSECVTVEEQSKQWE